MLRSAGLAFVLGVGLLGLGCSRAADRPPAAVGVTTTMAALQPTPKEGAVARSLARLRGPRKALAVIYVLTPKVAANATGRPDDEIDTVVRYLLRREIDASPDFAVAPFDPAVPPPNAAALGDLSAISLVVDVGAFEYDSDGLHASVRVRALSYPDGLVLRETSKRVTKTDAKAKSRADEDQLLELAVKLAAEQTIASAPAFLVQTSRR